MKKNMKMKMKKGILLASVLVMMIVTALAGCGQSAEVSSASASQSESAASVTITAVSENSEEVSPAQKEPEDDASDETPPAHAAESDSGASEGGTSASGDGNLSGIDLNVRFGDDGAPFALHLYDNETAAAIAGYVGTAAWRLPIYHYEGYDHWEVMQYYDIPSRYEIPSGARSVTSEKAGTVYYSEPNRIVLFFGDANVSSAYTPVGYIDYSQEFVEAVKNNPVLEGWGNKIVIISR